MYVRIMKKIELYQTPGRFHPAIGGVENHVLYLSKSLKSLDNNVTVVCADDPNSNRIFESGIRVLRLKYLFKITNTNITHLLPLVLFKANFDIIHTHMPTPWSADISIIIAKVKRRKSVLTIHNDINKTSFLSKLLTELYLNTVFKITLTLADRVIIVNKDWKKTFKNTHSLLEKYEKKIEYIPNGVDTKFFSKKKSTPKNEKGILFVSVLDRHHKYKGLDYLLKSLQIIKDKCPDVKLFVVGDGDMKDFYMKMAIKLGVSDYVEFLGSKTQAELVEIYSKCGIFVLPSTEIEGFGIVALESMSCATPVIVTDLVGVAANVLEYKAGFVVRPKSSLELAKKIMYLYSNSDQIGAMGKNGRMLVNKKYDWRRIARNTNRVYLNI